MDTGSSGRKWSARVLLALVGLWIVIKVVMLLRTISSGSSLALVSQFDVTNPSGATIIGIVSLIAYFFVRPKKSKVDDADDTAVVSGGTGKLP